MLCKKSAHFGPMFVAKSYFTLTSLEMALRAYACLTVGDTITIGHGSNTFFIDVVEVRPGNAISIIDTDVNVCIFVLATGDWL